MKLRRKPALIVVGLFLSTAGCGRPRPLAPWVPGIYHYRTTLPGTGEVAGSIEVGSEGPLSVTSNLGACRARIETTPRASRERLDGQLIVRTFICGTEHRISAPTAGRVRELLVAEGQEVDAGAPVAVLEAAGDG